MKSFICLYVLLLKIRQILSIWDTEIETYNSDEKNEVLSNKHVEEISNKCLKYQTLLGNLYDKEVEKRHDLFLKRKNDIEKEVESQKKQVEEQREAEIERLVLKYNLKAVTLHNDYMKKTNKLLSLFINSEIFDAEKHEEIQFKMDKEYIESFTRINTEYQQEISEIEDKYEEMLPDSYIQYEAEDAEQIEYDKDVLKITEKYKEREEEAIQNCVREVQECIFQLLENNLLKMKGDVTRIKKTRREMITVLVQKEIPEFLSLSSQIPDLKFVNKVYKELKSYVSTEAYLLDDTEEKRSKSLKYWLMGVIQINADPDSVGLYHVDPFPCKEKLSRQRDIYICQECKKAVAIIPLHQKMDIWFLLKDNHNFLRDYYDQE